MSKHRFLSGPVKGLLMDVSGVLWNGKVAIEGSVEAIHKLQKAAFPFKLVTNDSLRPRSVIQHSLNSVGFNLRENDLFTIVPVLKSILKREKLRPHLMLQEQMLKEFQDIDTSNPNCVVVGYAKNQFNYENLNASFKKLMGMENPLLLTMGIGRYFKADDQLVLDVGAFTKVLEYATGLKARPIGKPSPDFFMSAVSQLGLEPSQVAMVGDDLEVDVIGAQDAGLQGVLVRTGKFLPSVLQESQRKPDAVVDNLQVAVDNILAMRS